MKHVIAGFINDFSVALSQIMIVTGCGVHFTTTHRRVCEAGNQCNFVTFKYSYLEEQDGKFSLKK